ncbi:MAG: hypothetical protein R3A48_22245 [Polyangiales bacterium]
MRSMLRSGRRQPRTVEVCLTCGATPGQRVALCDHLRVGRVELTPRNARLLAQLRGAWSYARYMAERFEQTVEVEALAGRATVAVGDAPREPPRVERPAKPEPPPARQIPLFGEG